MHWFLSWICVGSLGSDCILPPVQLLGYQLMSIGLPSPAVEHSWSAALPGKWYLLLFILVLAQVKVLIIMI